MQKSFDKFQQPMKTKTNKQTNKKKTCKMAKGEICLNITKAIYDKPTTNIFLNGEKWKAFPLRSEQNQNIHSYHFYSI